MNKLTFLAILKLLAVGSFAVMGSILFEIAMGEEIHEAIKKEEPRHDELD